MQEVTQTGQSRSRIMRSARVLKAFFEHKLKLKLELLTEPPPEPLIEGIQFDLTINRWGIWGLKASRPIPEKQQSEICATFHGLLLAMSKLEDKRHDLMRLQEKFEASLDFTADNVIPLRRSRLYRLTEPHEDMQKRWILRLDCLIESPVASEIHKMALELHSQSQRYAFLEYHELQPEVRVDIAQLLQLGAISLFVPSILNLSLQEQAVLRRLIEMDSVQRPLLMVGANLPFAELRADASIDLEFLILLARAYIKLTRPFAEYKERGLIHYFLDSLAQNPT